MNLNLNELSLPNHILLALQGKLSAGNNINSAPLTTRAKPLNSQPVIIALASSVNALDSIYSARSADIECVQLSELTSFDILE